MNIHADPTEFAGKRVLVSGGSKGLGRATVDRFGGVDILVNNAGTSAAAAFEKVDDDTWHQDLELKLMAAVRFCRAVIPLMKQRGYTFVTLTA